MKEKIDALIQELNNATKAYDEGNPIMSDQDWDEKYFRLVAMESTANYYNPNSPTQKISYQVVNELNKITHEHQMLSLAKTKSKDEVESFTQGKTCLALHKLDGLTCSLTYEDGRLVRAETRGNGIEGEDILHNALVIANIPNKIEYKERLVVDGEIICTYKNFEEFKLEYKNPRNFAAGSIRLLDSHECQRRKLSFVAWEVIEGFNDTNSLTIKLFNLVRLGFGVTSFQMYSRSNLELMEQEKDTIPYPIDGIVIKFDDIEFGKSLGQTAHHFNNAIAYKFYDETCFSYLREIEWTMGRTGVLTPVAVFDPVEMDGSTVERANVHNISIMKNLFAPNGPYIGQKVEIYKANMIIPQIAATFNDTWNEDCEIINIPEVCPVCGGPTIERTEISSTVLYCNNPICEGKLINKLEHFCGKKGLDIKGISKATLEKLISWGWVNSISDIFTLSKYRNEWIKKPGFGEKSVDKVLFAIESGKKCELHQFISALGIPHIGTSVSKQLAQEFKTWDEFVAAAANSYKFYQLQGIGVELHSSLINFNYAEAINITNNYIIFNELIQQPQLTNQKNNLQGLTFVITGKLNTFKNRDLAKDKIEALGGKVASSVSKNTSYLINNDTTSNSAKNKSAKSLGIPILSEEEFIQLLEECN